jgi:hypothetical protein
MCSKFFVNTDFANWMYDEADPSWDGHNHTPPEQSLETFQ